MKVFANFEKRNLAIGEVQKDVNLIDLFRSFPTRSFIPTILEERKLASIQLRTSHGKLGSKISQIATSDHLSPVFCAFSPFLQGQTADHMPNMPIVLKMISKVLLSLTLSL